MNELQDALRSVEDQIMEQESEIERLRAHIVRLGFNPDAVN